MLLNKEPAALFESSFLLDIWFNLINLFVFYFWKLALVE